MRMRASGKTLHDIVRERDEARAFYCYMLTHWKNWFKGFGPEAQQYAVEWFRKEYEPRAKGYVRTHKMPI